jgi:DNA-binding transcriptional LysR family regulator
MLNSKLVTFLTVVRMKNYTHAAEILHLTQPAVSQQLRSLEEYYGVTLIEKKGRYLHLTKAGKLLLDYAKKMDELSKNLDIQLKNHDCVVKRYDLGATMTIGEYVFPSLLGKHKSIFQNMDIILHVHNTEEITQKLLERKLDLAAVEGPFDKTKFHYKKFKDDELVLAVSPQHPFASRKNVLLDELFNDQLILREKGSGTRKIFENKLIELGYNIQDLKIFMEIGSIHAIKSLVESSLGYTVISKQSIRKEIELGKITIVPIKNVRICREFYFIYLDDGDKKFIDRFINFCLLSYSHQS